jgi:HK97 family phage major capsid protein/HK97 family phage prohead protease
MNEIVRKAATAEVDGMEFVLSDATVDRYGDVVEPTGWDLRSFRKNPIALFGHSASFPIGKWQDVRVEDGKLKGRLEFAKAGTSYRIDELRRLVEQGILKAVSVGFRPLKAEPIDPADPRGGQRYKRQELLETSLVSVPANPAALAVARSLHISDDTLNIAFGEQAEQGNGIIVRRGTGEQAEPFNPITPRKTTTMNISNRIEDAQTKLLEARDALTAHVAQDDYDIDAEQALTDQVKHLEEKLASLKRAETSLAARAVERSPAAPAVRRPLSAVTAEPAPGDLVVRAAVVHALAHATGKQIDKVLDERYPGHEATSIVAKADMTIGTTGVSGWASQLINEATSDFINTLKPMSVFPGLAALGTSLTFNNGQGSIKLPSRVAGTNVNGSFVEEGTPIPVRRIATTSVSLTPRKMGVISAFSKELAKYSTPAIEGLIRSEIMADTAVTLDGALLDNAASSNARPAGLLRLVSAAANAYGGGDYLAFIEDMKALLAPFDTANAGRRLALIMHPAQRRSVSMMPGPDGTFGWADRFLSEFTILSSTSATAGRVIVVDAVDFAAAYGGMEFDVSEQATLHMEDTTPLEIVSGTGPTTADPVRSLFQTASVAVRMTMDVSWAMRRSGMVQYIDDVTW